MVFTSFICMPFFH